MSAFRDKFKKKKTKDVLADPEKWDEEPPPTAGAKFKDAAKTFGKGFGIAKQWSKQQMGKAEASQDDPETLAMIERLHGMNASFELLVKTSASVFAHEPMRANPAQVLLQNELHKAKILGREYKLAKLDYDNRNSSVMNLAFKEGKVKNKQLSDAKTRLADSTDNLEAVKTKLAAAVHTLDIRKDKVYNDTLESMSVIMESLQPVWRASGANNYPARAEITKSSSSKRRSSSSNTANGSMTVLKLDESLI